MRYSCSTYSPSVMRVTLQSLAASTSALAPCIPPDAVPQARGPWGSKLTESMPALRSPKATHQHLPVMHSTLETVLVEDLSRRGGLGIPSRGRFQLPCKGGTDRPKHRAGPSGANNHGAGKREPPTEPREYHDGEDHKTCNCQSGKPLRRGQPR